MNNLQTLKSLIEYRGTQTDNLFTKVLLDRAITAGDEYSASDAKNVDLALADVCLYLSTHPEEAEGKWRVKWSSASLLNLRSKLFSKHGLTAPEITNQDLNMPKITGKTEKVGDDYYSAW